VDSAVLGELAALHQNRRRPRAASCRAGVPNKNRRRPRVGALGDVVAPFTSFSTFCKKGHLDNPNVPSLAGSSCASTRECQAAGWRRRTQTDEAERVLSIVHAPEAGSPAFALEATAARSARRAAAAQPQGRPAKIRPCCPRINHAEAEGRWRQGGAARPTHRTPDDPPCDHQTMKATRAAITPGPQLGALPSRGKVPYAERGGRAGAQSGTNVALNEGRDRPRPWLPVSRSEKELVERARSTVAPSRCRAQGCSGSGLLSAAGSPGGNSPPPPALQLRSPAMPSKAPESRRPVTASQGRPG